MSSMEETKQEKKDSKSMIEALLFSSGKYMDEEHIAQIISIPVREVTNALRELKAEYEERGGSLVLIQEGPSWKINVRERYLDLVRKIVADTELSKTVLETLAIIAWKSPVKQSDVIKIRTNKAYDHIKELVDMGFVSKEPDGKSFELRVTEKFFEYFEVEGKEGLRRVFKRVEEEERRKSMEKELEVKRKGVEGKGKVGTFEVYEGTETESRDVLAEKEPTVDGLAVFDEPPGTSDEPSHKPPFDVGGVFSGKKLSELVAEELAEGKKAVKGKKAEEIEEELKETEEEE